MIIEQLYFRILRIITMTLLSLVTLYYIVLLHKLYQSKKNFTMTAHGSSKKKNYRSVSIQTHHWPASAEALSAHCSPVIAYRARTMKLATGESTLADDASSY
jgi:hypothetical protein